MHKEKNGIKLVKTIFSENVLSTLASVIISLVIGCMLILMISDNPIVAIKSLFVLPLSNKFYIATLLGKAVPLILLGLSASVTFQADYFNMGAQGQFYVGAFAAVVASIYIKGLPAVAHIIVVMLAGMIVAMIWALIAGFLKATLNISEIVVTLMLNYSATLLTGGMLTAGLRDPESSSALRSKYIPEAIELENISEHVMVNWGLLISLVVVYAVYVYLYKTSLGYKARLVGKNRMFAQYGGINISSTILSSFAISGAIAGLSGAIEILAIHHTFFDDFASSAGGDGLMVALLASSNPIGVVFAGLFFAYIKTGSQIMQQNTAITRDFALIIQAVTIMLISSRLLSATLNKRRLRKELRNIDK